MTSSAGASGLIFAGSPPRSLTASRMVARSTTQGTPVKSCMITRAGVNWISWLGSASGPTGRARGSWSAVMLAPSSVRSRFSSRTLRLYGRPVRALDRVEPEDLVRLVADPQVGPWLRSCPGSSSWSPSTRPNYLDVKIPQRSGAGHPGSGRVRPERREQQRDRLDVVGHREQVEGADAATCQPAGEVAQVAGEGGRVAGDVRDGARARPSTAARPRCRRRCGAGPARRGPTRPARARPASSDAGRVQPHRRQVVQVARASRTPAPTPSTASTWPPDRGRRPAPGEQPDAAVEVEQVLPRLGRQSSRTAATSTSAAPGWTCQNPAPSTRHSVRPPPRSPSRGPGPRHVDAGGQPFEGGASRAGVPDRRRRLEQHQLLAGPGGDDLDRVVPRPACAR